MRSIFGVVVFYFLFFVFSCSEPQSSEAIKYQKVQEITENGAAFPKYELRNENSELISSTQLSKGYVFYMFWGTWCASCIDNIVAVRDMKKKGLLSDVQFVSVSVDKDPDKWKQFIYQYDMADYMVNLLLGKDREHILSNFLYQEGRHANTEQVSYHYITPSYCLVRDGIIMDNHPMLPKDKNEFLNQFN